MNHEDLHSRNEWKSKNKITEHREQRDPRLAWELNWKRTKQKKWFVHNLRYWKKRKEKKRKETVNKYLNLSSNLTSFKQKTPILSQRSLQQQANFNRIKNEQERAPGWIDVKITLSWNRLQLLVVMASYSKLAQYS